MSMPTFPPHGADLTKDEALTMLLSSIAMEEAALSRILNAEGERLQAVLGALPGGCGPDGAAQEILEVNRSVSGVMDAVLQNQFLLKSKLESVLKASGRCPPAGESGCCETPCGKSWIQLAGRRDGTLWDDGSLLPWRCCGRRGGAIRWAEDRPALVRLDPNRLYDLRYTVNVCGALPGPDAAGSIFIRSTPRGALSMTPPLRFSVECPAGRAVTLQSSAMLFPQPDAGPWVEFGLLLRRRNGLFVERAALSIVEL